MPNLTAASQNLYELVKSQGLAVYPDAEIRLAVNRAIALETTRGWKITKEKTSHHVDILVALAMAAYAAVQRGERSWMRVGFSIHTPVALFYYPDEEERPRPRVVRITSEGRPQAASITKRRDEMTMTNEEFAAFTASRDDCSAASQLGRPELLVHWQRGLHACVDEARERVSKAYTLMDEIDRDADLSPDAKYRQRSKVAAQAIADFEASKTLARRVRP